MPGAYHLPVLVQEVCAALLPPLRAASSAGATTTALTTTAPVFVDCTCGGAGHSEALLRAASEFPARPRFLALDRDPDALAHARDRLTTLGLGLELHHRPFSQLAAVLAEAKIPAVTAILADLGVSSHQLDTGTRGFSFQADAPLDMRMDPTRGVPLSAVLADLDLGTLTQILRDLGEEPDAHRIARHGLTPGDAELADNPRSRSSRLRVLERVLP